MADDVKKLRKRLKQDGWRVELGNRHYKAYHPKGGFVTLSVSPSCNYAYKNMLGDINRLKRSHSEGDLQ